MGIFQSVFAAARKAHFILGTLFGVTQIIFRQCVPACVQRLRDFPPKTKTCVAAPEIQKQNIGGEKKYRRINLPFFHPLLKNIMPDSKVGTRYHIIKIEDHFVFSQLIAIPAPTTQPGF